MLVYFCYYYTVESEATVPKARKYIEGIDQPDVTKGCNDCDQLFPLTQENFYFAARANGTYTASAYCIPCSKRRGRKRNRMTPEQLQEVFLLWRVFYSEMRRQLKDQIRAEVEAELLAEQQEPSRFEIPNEYGLTIADLADPD